MTNSISQKFTLTSLFRFSLPSILMLILTSLYTAVDGVFVSRFVGSDALSAINIILPLDSIIIGLSIMFGTGAGGKGKFCTYHHHGYRNRRCCYSAFCPFPAVCHTDAGGKRPAFPLLYRLWIHPGTICRTLYPPGYV